VRFSLCVDAGRSWAEVLALVRLVEALGWDGVYVCDHFMPYDPNGVAVNGAMLEGWTTLAALARCRVVAARGGHHPAALAAAAPFADPSQRSGTSGRIFGRDGAVG
jgi:alkanesulfonate monooxygenase SsuD/methylene tetrahydromethanopterin reductase-like flavin-dependent oxidoreductase (luciferase family)